MVQNFSIFCGIDVSKGWRLELLMSEEKVHI
uniref:Uncharacterized protein n=1 Tax=Candidatus Berkiella cookevillensis TaxID=437022 RepID=A0A0Q9YJQ1_9GAMM